MLRLVVLVAQVVWEPGKHCQKAPSGVGGKDHEVGSGPTTGINLLVRRFRHEVAYLRLVNFSKQELTFDLNSYDTKYV